MSTRRRSVRKPLAGGGARARTRALREPKTRADLLRARAAYCADRPGSGCGADIEAASFEQRAGSGRIARYRERILDGEIAPGKAGCTVFITRAEDTGQGVPNRPYNVSTLCQGGRRVWGGDGYASLDAARRAMKLKLR